MLVQVSAQNSCKMKVIQVIFSAYAMWVLQIIFIFHI